MIEINNLNVLFLVLNFISQYDIDYFEDEITLEIDCWRKRLGEINFIIKLIGAGGNAR